MNEIVEDLVRDCLEENYEFGFSSKFSDLLEYQFAMRLNNVSLKNYAREGKELSYKAVEANQQALLRKLKDKYQLESFDELNEVISKYYNVRANEVVYGS